MTSKLFTPLAIGKLEIANRITVSPMCQYSADDGSMTDWHMGHLMPLAFSGAGLVTIEATHVAPEGRITHGCVGMYSDANEQAMKRVLDACRRYAPNARFSLQLAHAGRKASSQRPWEGRGALGPGENPWTTVGPSALALAAGWHTPAELDRAGMTRVREAFVAAVKRAVRLDVDAIEVHSAHGYLMAEFLSPLANKRSDEYGGSLANRMRFPLETFEAMRAAWPAGKPMGVRINGSDFAEGGFTTDEAVAYSRELQKRGADFITASGGGTTLDAKVPLGPGYQVPFAERIKREVGIVTGAVGLITEPRQAEEIVASGKADYVALARAFLFDPRWPWHAALALGAELKYVSQYERCHPNLWPPAKALARG